MTLHLRRGSSITQPSFTYGPIAGAEWVRSNATTQAVTVFPGTPGLDFTQLNPTNSPPTNQAAITNDMTGKIWWPLGSYSCPAGGFSIKHGQEHRLASIAGRTRTSADSAVLTASGGYCIQTEGGTLGMPITVKGGVLKSATSYGFVVNDAATVLEDAICELNYTGIYIAKSAEVRRSIFRDNTVKGIGASTGWTSLLLEYVEVDNNNTSHASPDVDASGCKILLSGGVGTETLIARYLWVHDNYGRGFWCDTVTAGSILVEESVFETNAWNGFMYEDSSGTSVVRRNHVIGNCWETGVAAGNWNRMTQMLWSRSNGTEGGGGGHDISYNYVYGTGDTATIALIDNNPVGMRGANVHHNDLWFPSTFRERVGGKVDAAYQATSPIYGGTNAFNYNVYHAPNATADYFAWGNSGGAFQNLDWNEWKAYGHDASGTLVMT